MAPKKKIVVPTAVAGREPDTAVAGREPDKQEPWVPERAQDNLNGQGTIGVTRVRRQGEGGVGSSGRVLCVVQDAHSTGEPAPA